MPMPTQTVLPLTPEQEAAKQAAIAAWTQSSQGRASAAYRNQQVPPASLNQAPGSSGSSDSGSWWGDAKNAASNLPGGLPGLPGGIPGLPGSPTHPSQQAPAQGGYTPQTTWSPGAGQVSMPPGGPSAGLLGLSMTTLALIGAGLYFGLPYLKKM